MDVDDVVVEHHQGEVLEYNIVLLEITCNYLLFRYTSSNIFCKLLVIICNFRDFCNFGDITCKLQKISIET